MTCCTGVSHPRFPKNLCPRRNRRVWPPEGAACANRTVRSHHALRHNTALETHLLSSRAHKLPPFPTCLRRSAMRPKTWGTSTSEVGLPDITAGKDMPCCSSVPFRGVSSQGRVTNYVAQGGDVGFVACGAREIASEGREPHAPRHFHQFLQTDVPFIVSGPTFEALAASFKQLSGSSASLTLTM